MAFGDRVTRRYVLREFPAEDVVAEFAEGADWGLVSRTPADAESGVDYEVGWATDDNLTFHYVEDSVVMQSYVFVEGDDFDKVDDYEEQIKRGLDLWTLDELLQAAADEPAGPDRSRAVLRAGLGAPMQFDQRFFDVITGAMADPDGRVRSVGILASTYSPWPQYRPVLERISKNDPEQDTRELAQATLRAFDQHGVGQP